MDNTIFELIKSHCSIFNTSLQNVKVAWWTGIFQLDFLSWYPWIDSLEAYWVPFDVTTIKDNPNWIPTEYENVYMIAEYKWENVSVDYQILLSWHSPIRLINRWYFKVRQWDKYDYRWRVSVYWKALKLYYMWYLPRLQNYIIKYSWECCRADLCWDFKHKIPDACIDLPITWTNHETTYFWEKNSPLFFRTYDKTKDLRREKNCNARLYPNWYQKECRRLEAQLSWRYSRAMSPLDWLDVIEVDKSKIEKIEKLNRNVYKTALYSVINTIDWINMSNLEKLDILMWGKKVLDLKLKKLQKWLL